MEFDQSHLREIGLQVFGRISASISHEVKNHLAIINENAGLLDDIAIMSENSRPIEKDRIQTLAEKMMRQIERADMAIRNMNRFSHSVDLPLQNADIGETISLVLTLSNRLIANSGIRVEMRPPKESIFVRTHLFYFMTILFLYLEYTLSHSDKGKTITITTQKQEKNIEILFGDMVYLDEEIFPDEAAKAVLSFLDAQSIVDPAQNQLGIRMRT